MHITDRLCWEKHISETCRKAYLRVNMLSKLKYVSVHTEDLITPYSLGKIKLTKPTNFIAFIFVLLYCLSQIPEPNIK